MYMTVLSLSMTCTKLNICPCQHVKIATGALQFAALQLHICKYVKSQGLHFFVDLICK